MATFETYAEAVRTAVVIPLTPVSCSIGSRVRRCCCQHPLPSELHGRHFDACSSSIEQRPCEIRSGTVPPAHDTSSEARLPHWTWGQPGRYCARAGYRDECRGGGG